MFFSWYSLILSFAVILEVRSYSVVDSPQLKTESDSTQIWNVIEAIDENHDVSNLTREFFSKRQDPIGVEYNSTTHSSNRVSGHNIRKSANAPLEFKSDDSPVDEVSNIDPDSNFALVNRENLRYSQEPDDLRQLKDKLQNLTSEQRDHLEESDALAINDIEQNQDCFLCSVAGYDGLTISQFAKQHKLNLSMYNDGTSAQVRDLLAKVENLGPKNPTTFEGIDSKKKLVELLSKNIPRGHQQEFVLGYWQDYAKNTKGRLVKARAWKSSNSDDLKFLFIDFQEPPDSQRITTELNPNAKKLMIINPKGIEFHFETEKIAAKSELVAKFGDATTKQVRKNLIEQRSNMPDMYRSHVKPNDLSDVDAGTKLSNCFVTIPAVLSGGLTATQLLTTNNVSMSDLVRGGGKTVTVERIVEVYRRLGFPDTKVVHSGDLKSVDEYLNKYMPSPGAEITIPIAYERLDGIVKVVLVKAWRDASQRIRCLVVDFCSSPSNQSRFKLSLRALDQHKKDTSLHVISLLNLNLRTSRMLAETLVLESTSSKKCARRVIGYLPSWSPNSFEVSQAVHYTDIIYSFIKMDGSGKLYPPTDTLATQRLIELFKAKKELKSRGIKLRVLFAIGGWSDSQHFSSVLSDADKRDRFVQSIADYVHDHKFNGVDIDWEYPVSGGETQGKPQDRTNYVTFVKQLRSKLKPTKSLSIAGAAGAQSMTGFNMEELVKHVDWIGVMTYDFYGAWDSSVGPNSALYHGGPHGESEKQNTEWAINQYLQATREPSKIVLGVPFYGRYWTKTRDGDDPNEHPLFRRAIQVDGKFGGDKSFKELQGSWLKPNSEFKIYWDEKTRTPWALQSSTGLTISYDNAESIRQKAVFAHDRQLGGIMVWSIEQDDTDLTLTKSLANACSEEPPEDVPPSDSKPSPGSGTNPLGNEIRWWTYAENPGNAGKCGKNAPLYNGYYARCNPNDQGYACCSSQGYCGAGSDYCDCPTCTDYAKHPEKLTEEPLKPPQAAKWHIGYDLVRPGEPRCGSRAPRINGNIAICSPNDADAHCCSKWGYCGIGSDFCDCDGCINYK